MAVCVRARVHENRKWNKSLWLSPSQKCSCSSIKSLGSSHSLSFFLCFLLIPVSTYAHTHVQTCKHAIRIEKRIGCKCSHFLTGVHLCWWANTSHTAAFRYPKLIEMLFQITYVKWTTICRPNLCMNRIYSNKSMSMNPSLCIINCTVENVFVKEVQPHL